MLFHRHFFFKCHEGASRTNLLSSTHNLECQMHAIPTVFATPIIRNRIVPLSPRQDGDFSQVNRIRGTEESWAKQGIAFLSLCLTEILTVRVCQCQQNLIMFVFQSAWDYVIVAVCLVLKKKIELSPVIKLTNGEIYFVGEHYPVPISHQHISLKVLRIYVPGGNILTKI